MSEFREYVPEEASQPAAERGERRGVVSRRQFLKLFGVGGLATLAASEVGAVSPQAHTEAREGRPQVVRTGALAGIRTKGSLLEHYLGRYEALPAEIQVDFTTQLRQMWGLKLHRYGRRPELRQVADALCTEYESTAPQPSSVQQYAEEVQGMVEQVFHSFDWTRLTQERRVDPVALELVRAIAERMSYKELFALCMTELLPLATAQRNEQLLDLILRSAGSEFLERVPALFDRYVSFGPYQFTKFALSETEDRAVGASHINPILPPELRLPRQVQDLRSIHHHIAAIAFMVENACLLVQRAQDRGLVERLWKAVEEQSLQVLTCLGAAHHAPRAAVEALLSWLARPEGREYAAVVRGEPGVYAKRYARNLIGLYAESAPEAEAGDHVT